MRILKGHVTMASRGLELSCVVPKGMSGSPVIVGREVVGWATGSIRSEELDDSVEEETEGGKVVRRIEVRRVVQYGLARSFYSVREVTDRVLDGMSLPQFVHARNLKD
jgi:hypothetical protein